MYNYNIYPNGWSRPLKFIPLDSVMYIEHFIKLRNALDDKICQKTLHKIVHEYISKDFFKNPYYSFLIDGKRFMPYCRHDDHNYISPEIVNQVNNLIIYGLHLLEKRIVSSHVDFSLNIFGPNDMDLLLLRNSFSY